MDSDRISILALVPGSGGLGRDAPMGEAFPTARTLNAASAKNFGDRQCKVR
jgi:hypothetical protein